MRRWHSLVLKELVDADFCEVATLIVDGTPSTERGRTHASAFVRHRAVCRHLLYRLYERADRRKFALPDDPLSLASIEELATKARLGLAVAVRNVDLSAGDHEAIARDELDVLLCLTADADVLLLAPCARFGAMSFEASESGEDLPLFRETSEAAIRAAACPIVSAVHIATQRYGTRALCRSSTYPQPLSLRRNRNKAHAKAPHLLLRALRQLYRHGWEAIVSAPVADAWAIGPRIAPTNVQMLRFLWRVYLRRVQGRFHRYLFEDQWYLAYRRRPDVGKTVWFAPGDASVGLRWKVIRPPLGRFYADPFVVRSGDRHLVFFEDYDGRTERGAISYIEIDRHGRRSAPRPALTRDYHLSYPFVFRERDAIYLLPETYSQRRIELYRATSFPHEWKLERVLIEDISGVDATLLRRRGTFWLFVGVVPGGGPPVDELHLFYSDSLLGEWRPHPMNPVVADAGSARPAGRIFCRGDEVIRPAQDGARSYGRRVILNRIEVLDRTGYRESPVASIEPARTGRARKTHTYNFDGDYEVVDGWRFYPRVRVPDIVPWRADRRLWRFHVVPSDHDAGSANRR
jgi:hypothetical protein